MVSFALELLVFPAISRLIHFYTAALLSMVSFQCQCPIIILTGYASLCALRFVVLKPFRWLLRSSAWFCKNFDPSARSILSINLRSRWLSLRVVFISTANSVSAWGGGPKKSLTAEDNVQLEASSWTIQTKGQL
jgi:hypothetical protein